MPCGREGEGGRAALVRNGQKCREKVLSIREQSAVTHRLRVSAALTLCAVSVGLPSWPVEKPVGILVLGEDLPVAAAPQGRSR